MINFEEIKRKWADIPAYSSGFLSLEGEHPLKIHIGYSSPNEQVLLILDAEYEYDIPSTRIIEVQKAKLKDETSIIELRLKDNSFSDLFIRLAWDIIEFSFCNNRDESLKRFINRYKSWYGFLQAAGKDMLTSSEQKGLFGELLYLNELFETFDYNKAINSWCGPEGADQDFVFNNTWAEVKSVNVSADSVKISSIQQLDSNEPGTLIVYFFDKTTSENQFGASLSKKISEIRQRLEESYETEKQIFELKLFRYGYLDKDSEEYEKTKYLLVEKRTYKVSSDFPKLSRKNIPASIINANYLLDIASIEQFRIME